MNDRQEPWEILNPRDALIEAARLNREAVVDLANGEVDAAGIAAHVALSLSTYALAMYKRDAP